MTREAGVAARREGGGSWRPRLAEGTAPVLVVLFLLLVGLAVTGPAYDEPSGYLALLKRAAPLMILAIGQYFVIVSGGFDLSVGALVTAGVVIAARLIDGDESATTGWSCSCSASACWSASSTGWSRRSSWCRRSS